MTSQEDLLKIFEEVEASFYAVGNLAKTEPEKGNSKVTYSRYVAPKVDKHGSKVITPKQFADRRARTKEDIKRTKFMERYAKQVEKLEKKRAKANEKLDKKRSNIEKRTARKRDNISKKKELKLSRQDRKQEKAQKRKVYKTAKTIEKSVSKAIREEDRQIKEDKKEQLRIERERIKDVRKNKDKKRLTPPKKRNIFSRFSHMIKYTNSDIEYEAIEEDIADYKAGNLSKEYMESQWEDIQEYEDARDDATLRRGWNAFKLTLAGVALAGALFSIKTMHNEFAQMQARADESIAQENIEYTIKRAESSSMRLEDQKFFYEYTDGNPTLENWEKLPKPIQESIRNPVGAFEAAAKYHRDLAEFYVMTGGDISTETWEKLPEELKHFIREPVSTAKEYFEAGQDQRYLYDLSRGVVTDEFWQTLPDEVKKYVRNPVELAKEFAEKGDVAGYMKNILADEVRSERDMHEFWRFLPEEIKEYVQDPLLVNAKQYMQQAGQDTQQTQAYTDDELGER